MLTKVDKVVKRPESWALPMIVVVANRRPATIEI